MTRKEIAEYVRLAPPGPLADALYPEGWGRVNVNLNAVLVVDEATRNILWKGAAYTGQTDFAWRRNGRYESRLCAGEQHHIKPHWKTGATRNVQVVASAAAEEPIPF